MNNLTKATIERVAKHTGRTNDAATDLLVELGYRVWEAERERIVLPAALRARLEQKREHSGAVIVSARVSADLAAKIKSTASAAKTTTSTVIASLVGDALK